MSDFVSEFRSAMAGVGLVHPGLILSDGKLHRFKCEGDHADNSWYVLHSHDRFAAGAFGCWKRQINQTWNSSNGSELTGEERRQLRQKLQESERDRRTEEEKRQSEAKLKASELLSAATVPQSHPYLERKKCGIHGELRVDKDGLLLLPLRDSSGTLQSLQFIAPDKRFNGQRDKDFIFGGKVQGCFYTISDNPQGPLVICEGYATGASVFEATGFATICAMNCGNMLAVAQSIRKLHPSRVIVLAADNDRFTTDNPGLTKATQAAKTVNGCVAVPDGFSDTDLKSTDFNDLARVSGLPAVASIITKSIPVFAVSIGDLTLPPPDDPSELLKHRFLCRRGSLLIVGSTGKGKSSLLIQALSLWANGLPFFGIKPTRCLRSIYIQAENDDGDIAAIRNGVCTGLKFTEAQRLQFFKNVLVFTSADHSGKQFCSEIVRPLLSNHSPDIIAIDPALSYLGGDTKEQRDVGLFLRNYINPLLIEFNCAVIINHHTNKISAITGDDSSESVQDFAYFGSGSAEWGNWSRASLALETTKTKGVFRLHAGKRGSKIGWKNPDDSTSFSRLIAHSTDSNTIYWRDAEDSELPPSGRPKSFDEQSLLDLISENSLSTSEWQKIAREELNIARSPFYRALEDLQKQGKILKSKINSKWCLVDLKK